MKFSQPMMKLIIKTLILMMLFVIMFMISSFLYSAKYWPDVYNYINANITIKRIPTISELDLTVIEVDFTTETYTTTDVEYIDVSTIDDFDIDEFMKDEIDVKKKVKRSIVIEQLKDYIELPPRPVFVDYIFLEEPVQLETVKNKPGDELKPKEIDEDKGIFKTLVTGIVLEDELPKTTVSEEPAVTKKYYTVQPPKSKESKRCIDEEPSTTVPDITEPTQINHSTTIEGYLDGNDNDLKATVDEEPNTTDSDITEPTQINHSTTIEGYLDGDDNDLKATVDEEHTTTDTDITELTQINHSTTIEGYLDGNDNDLKATVDEEHTTTDTDIPEPTQINHSTTIEGYLDGDDNDLKAMVDEEHTTTNTDITELTEINTTYTAEHITTKEGYLIGDDFKLKAVDEEPVELKTNANENELVDDENDKSLIRDSVDVSNLSTRGTEDVEMVTRKPWKLQMMPDPVCHGDAACQDFTMTVFPWIASIFVTNTNQENQFSYFCDGVLLTEKVIVTDARCMIVGNQTWDPDNLLVFLGKVNLQAFGGNEKVHKVNSIVIHPNFTIAADAFVENDLALIVLEDSVMFMNNIQSACIHQENSIEESATTAWDLNGALVPIFFNRQKGPNCFDQGDVFCASYGNEVALCPSYGGIFASRQVDRWCLTGIFYGDPANRGICFTKDVHYTSLTKHLKWIDDTVGMFKNGIL